MGAALGHTVHTSRQSFTTRLLTGNRKTWRWVNQLSDLVGFLMRAATILFNCAQTQGKGVRHSQVQATGAVRAQLQGRGAVHAPALGAWGSMHSAQ